MGSLSDKRSPRRGPSGEDWVRVQMIETAVRGAGLFEVGRVGRWASF
jgi:hypothetical protein